MSELQRPEFFHGDAIEWLCSLKDSSVDLICTDPAYESLEKHRKVGTTTRLKKSKGSSNEWFPIFPNSRFPAFFEQCFRVLRNNRHCYVLCDQETMFAIKPIGEEVGFKFWKPIIWDKQKIGMGYHYRARYEVILFFEKGKRKLNYLGVPDVLSVSRVHDGYPTEKPVELISTLIKQSTRAGELVIDPFMGSGSCAVAATAHGCQFKGCDISLDALRYAEKRVHNADD